MLVTFEESGKPHEMGIDLLGLPPESLRAYGAMTAHSAVASLSTVNPTTSQARRIPSIIAVGTLGMVSSCAEGACFSQTSLVMRGIASLVG
jgi:hypothetical protein